MFEPARLGESNLLFVFAICTPPLHIFSVRTILKYTQEEIVAMLFCATGSSIIMELLMGSSGKRDHKFKVCDEQDLVLWGTTFARSWFTFNVLNSKKISDVLTIAVCRNWTNGTPFS